MINLSDIEHKAAKTREAAALSGQFPVDIEKIADHLGYKCFLFDPQDAAQMEISGAVNHEKKIIYLNQNENFRRQFFTLAHEIGHIVLHGNQENFIDYRLSFGGISEDKEKEANYFAAELIMPREIFIYKWSALKGNLEALSDFFGASPSAISIRAEILKLF